MHQLHSSCGWQDLPCQSKMIQLLKASSSKTQERCKTQVVPKQPPRWILTQTNCFHLFIPKKKRQNHGRISYTYPVASWICYARRKRSFYTKHHHRRFRCYVASIAYIPIFHLLKSNCHEILFRHHQPFRDRRHRIDSIASITWLWRRCSFSSLGY